MTALVAIFAALQLSAQSVILNNNGKQPTVAIKNAMIVPVTAAVCNNCTIVFSGGKITAIGASVVVPDGATVIDGTGLRVYPGMIDSGTHVGLTEIESVPGTNDISELGDLNPNAFAAIAVNPHSNLIPVTRINGITSVVVKPDGGIVSGQSALIQLSGWTPKEMVIQSPLALNIDFPRLRSASFDEQPQEEEAEKEARKTYTEQLDKLRDLFRDANAYAKAASARMKDVNVKRYDRDVMLEAMVPIVEGKVPVIIHANLERDIRAAIKFADDEKVKMILSDADDVARVIPELKKHDIPVILGPILAMPPREDDPYDLIFTNAAKLHEAGIRFAIQSDDAHNARNLPYHAAMCAAFGLPKDVALKAITIYPAQIFGVADRIGSLEVGKRADLFVSDGDPLEITTNIKRVFIDGEDIPMESNQTLLYKKFMARP
ncbi:MAG TPA: amidohydrolase family protein [Thermoanaerobaculia bacterium]|jgi:imidazolonepropionase-like amidohydrolase|nr:amidohydrolase family protein [Thermoanaerobaculia bacterium]